MATDINVPVALAESADEYISQYGDGTATIYLAYGSASPPTDGTASTLVVSGTERYDFWVQTAVDSYFQWTVGDGTDTGYTSEVFQAPNTYATLNEVTQGMDLASTDDHDELERLLLDATDYVTNVVCGGRSFLRDPVGSDETVLQLDIGWPRQASLWHARGQGLDIQSLSKVEIADYTGDSYTEIASDDYFLAPDVSRTGWPYTDLILSDQGDVHTYYPQGYRVVQLTGVFGWAAVPEMVRRATIDLTRYWFRDRGNEGEPVGISAFGTPIFGANVPKTVRDLARSTYAWKGWVG